MKLSKCKHCGLEKDISTQPKGWMANHSRWCEKNPKRNQYVNNSANALAAMKKARETTGRVNQYSAAKLDGITIPPSPNKGKQSSFLGKTHSEKTKSIISEKARKSKHRRLRKGMVEYNGVMLDSDWEVRLAKKLDADKIDWIRPNPIPYLDKEGKIRNYFPDFYLPQYDLYLDPKNPQAARVQQDKIDCINSQYKNVIFILSVKEIDNFAPILALSSKQ